ncbi:nuclear transport factor 2 family protein [Streptomyces malaysiensis]|uniref:Ketosteroid isomerase-like protein n=1 Tax=Streptomyces malaysiensis TaxID=92644 RepID=A0A7X6B1K3_STRMQ|nr:nuclear transport factor 2 family protein [Streptomyces malaysiensis]NIY69382.1 ketosteroid isomerase-like protein [Streptomyces malaysiensis]
MDDEAEFPVWLAEAAIGLADGDVDTWLRMYADDAVHEFPFAAAGDVRRLEGTSQIRAYMAAMDGSVQFGTLDDITVRELGEEVMIEAEGHHFDATTGDPFDIRYLWIIARRDGLVTHLKDYMGPRRPVGGAA